MSKLLRVGFMPLLLLLNHPVATLNRADLLPRDIAKCAVSVSHAQVVAMQTYHRPK